MIYYVSPSIIPKSLKNTSKFFFPHGLCQAVTTYEISQINSFMWMGLYPNVVGYLTDPEMLTYSSIDIRSQSGDKIACNFGRVCTYEVSIIVTDLRHPVSPDTCSDEISYNGCIEEQTKNIHHEVINQTNCIQTGR